jgi:hypothetical protein
MNPLSYFVLFLLLTLHHSVEGQRVRLTGNFETAGEFGVATKLGPFSIILQVDTGSSGVAVFDSACATCPAKQKVTLLFW